MCGQVAGRRVCRVALCSAAGMMRGAMLNMRNHEVPASRLGKASGPMPCHAMSCLLLVMPCRHTMRGWTGAQPCCLCCAMLRRGHGWDQCWAMACLTHLMPWVKLNGHGLAIPCHAIPCRAVPSHAVPCPSHAHAHAHAIPCHAGPAHHLPCHHPASRRSPSKPTPGTFSAAPFRKAPFFGQPPSPSMLPSCRSPSRPTPAPLTPHACAATWAWVSLESAWACRCACLPAHVTNGLPAHVTRGALSRPAKQPACAPPLQGVNSLCACQP